MRVVLAVALALCPSDAARRKQEDVIALDASSNLTGSQTTIEGCQCTSTCNAVIRDAFNCDTCRTANGCGKFSVTGRYDHCDFSPAENFESQTFSQKINYYERELARDPTVRATAPSTLDIAIAGFTSSMHTTFDNFLPEMPEGRIKFIHTVGSVCGIDLEVASNSKYTGLLSPGTQKGFIRMGPATKPSETGLAPGWGFKFPRSGVQSGDFVAMWGVDQGQSFNFFAKNISNKIASAQGGAQILAKAFEKATICSPQVGLSDFAKYSQDGKKTTPKFPYKLFFIPTAEVQTSTRVKTQEDILAEFASIPVGTTLHHVYACDEATAFEAEDPGTLEKHCGANSYVGSIKLSSKCSTSDYGDQKFHIRHQRIEDDWELRPDFKGKEACGRSDRDWRAGSPSRCPGAVMLNTE